MRWAAQRVLAVLVLLAQAWGPPGDAARCTEEFAAASESIMKYSGMPALGYSVNIRGGSVEEILAGADLEAFARRLRNAHS